MKKILGFAMSIVVTLLVYLPYSGLLFLLAVVVAGASSFFNIGPALFAGAVLGYAWKVYFCFLVVTIFCMTTFSFLHCCVGLNTFKGHIRHYGKQNVENLIIGLLWPVAWQRIDRNLKGWGLCWMDVVLGTVEFWFVTIRKGVRIDFVNLKSGEEKTVFSKSPKETKDFTEQILKEKLR